MKPVVATYTTCTKEKTGIAEREGRKKDRVSFFIPTTLFRTIAASLATSAQILTKRAN
jgi:hypothetical protein